MRTILERLKMEIEKNNNTERGENEVQSLRCMLVTVIRASGSTPRKPGAIMLVGETGVLEGTVGGGLLEHTCTIRAQECMAQGVGCIESYILENTKAEALGMICGGQTEVLFTPVNAAMIRSVEDGLQLMKIHQYGCLSIGLQSGKVAIEATGAYGQVSIVEKDVEACIYIPLVSAERVILIGGGHVALELSKLLDYLNFRYVIIEDRKEFGNTERFPNAEEVMVCDYEALEEVWSQAAFLPVSEKDGFCVLTRGHKGDTHALRIAMKTKAGYIGAMGSRRKRELVLRQLDSEGYQDVYQRIITPIGLDIGAQTPEELAVSIAGQLIQWRAGKDI